MLKPPPPPRRSAAPARKPAPTFAALVAAAGESGILTTDRATVLLTREAEQKALVLAQLRAEQRNQAGASIQTPQADVSALELFMSFRELAHDGQPLREDLITELFAKLVDLPYIKLDPLKLDADFAIRVVSKPFARKHGYLALDEADGVVRIATYDPSDDQALESVARAIGKRIALVIASKSDVLRLITEFYGFRQSVKKAEKQITEGIELSNLEQLVRMKSEQEIDASDEYVVHAVDYMLRYAFGQRASDVHIEPKRSESIVRFRIDGALHVVSRLPRVVHKAVVNRIKTLSRLDIAERRRPQDGRIKTEHQGVATEIRVSTLPVAFGEKLVLRIFDPTLVHDDLGLLGFGERDRTVFEELIQLPHGIILVTGPTGSGKTTTLYTALRRLAQDDINITTIEDPIENVFEGINQTAIAPHVGLGFAEVLRTILRQDPDVIMVGEIRDLDTARNAIQAALTGHLVFSTLHTNDAASAITRLLDLGVAEFLLSSTLAGVMAQRLVRRNCPACAEERVLKPEECATLGIERADGDVLVRFGKGCADCRMSGYRGRTALVELFRVTTTIRELIHRRADEAALKAEAKKDGMRTLREAAIAKLLLGETTYEEVVSITTEA